MVNFLSNLGAKLFILVGLCFSSATFGQDKDGMLQRGNQASKIRVSAGLLGATLQSYKQLSPNVYAFAEAGWTVAIHGGTDHPNKLLFSPQVFTELRWFLNNKPYEKSNGLNYAGLGRGFYASFGNRLSVRNLFEGKSIRPLESGALLISTNQVYAHLGYQTVWRRRFVTSINAGLGYDYSFDDGTPKDALGFTLISYFARISFLLW